MDKEVKTEAEKRYLKNQAAKRYRDKNQEAIKKLRDEWKEKNPDYHKNYRDSNVEKIKEYRKERYQNNIEKEKEYYLNNKEEISKKASERHNKRRNTDPLYKLKCNIRTNMYCALTRKNHRKTCKTVEILGCSFEEFKKYIEAQWQPWMNWENYGKYNGELNFGWDVDHIIPASMGKTEEEIIKLNHYTNFQPLCSKVNRNIKRAKHLSS